VSSVGIIVFQLNSTSFPQRVKNIYNWIIMTKNKKKKKSPNCVAEHHVVHFYFLQNQDLFQDLSTEMWYLFVNCRYIFCTKELSSIQILTFIVFTSQSHKVAYFYDVGSTYAIDQKINHLHNDRVANMWRNNVPSVCGRG
jgi:hypothetical protein